MKFIVFHVLYAFCVFYVTGDLITEFESFLKVTSKSIADFEHEFFNSVIVLVSNLKDTSTETLGESWNATMTLADALNEKANTKEKKDCIAVESQKLIKIINTVAFTLDTCREKSSATIQPLRTKIQANHQATMAMENDLETIRSSCAEDAAKSEECVSRKVNEFRASLENMLVQLDNYMIEAGTMKPHVLSIAMNCNAKILKEVHEEVTSIQENLQKCA